MPWFINDVYEPYIYILNIKNANYPCIVNEISKREAAKFLQNIDLSEKSETLFTSNSNFNEEKKNRKLWIKRKYKNLKKYIK